MGVLERGLMNPHCTTIRGVASVLEVVGKEQMLATEP
jgi:hypothetical protein